MISTVLSWGSTILGFSKLISPENKTIGDAKDAVDKTGSIYNILSGKNSAAKSAMRTYIRPMVGVESGLIPQEFAPDLMNVIQLRDILSVLTHLEMQGTVGQIKISSLVDSVNPSRTGLAAYAGAESFGRTPIAGLESNVTNVNKKEITINGKAYTELNEYRPLAVGRTVMAEVGVDDKKISFPLTFRNIVVPMDSKDLEIVFSGAKIDLGFYARKMLLDTGEITGPEFFTGEDLIKEKFRIKNQELSGYYEEAVKREQNNRLAFLRSGIISMNTLANTLVISSDTARNIELENGFRFDNSRSISKLFSRVSANCIVVCNDNRGIFTFYTDGESIPETYTRNELKSKAGKDSTASLQDLQKLLFGGV